MRTPFRAFLHLNTLEERYVPDGGNGNPPDPDPGHVAPPPKPTSFFATDINQDLFSSAASISIVLDLEDGRTLTFTVPVTQGDTPASVTLQFCEKLNQAGFWFAVGPNGTSLEIYGIPDASGGGMTGLDKGKITGTMTNGTILPFKGGMVSEA